MVLSKQNRRMVLTGTGLKITVRLLETTNENFHPGSTNGDSRELVSILLEECSSNFAFARGSGLHR